MAYGAYDRMVFHSGLADGGFATAITITSGAADKSIFTVLEPLVVIGFRCLVTTSVVTVTIAGVVSLDYRPTFNSDSSRVELVALTFPSMVAGKILYKNFAPKKVLPGTQLVTEHKTQATGGGAAGVVQPYIVFAPAAEYPGGCAKMVLSA